MLDPDQIEQANAMGAALHAECAAPAQERKPTPYELGLYNHEAFVADLDVAIQRIEDQVVGDYDSVRRIVAPLGNNITMREATTRLCITLLLRQLTVGRFAEKISGVLAQTRELLIEKNKAYGNSALDPVRIFSSASALEQILVRLDDKASRLARGSDAGEDVTADMLGYIVLAEIAKIRQERAASLGPNFGPKSIEVTAAIGRVADHWVQSSGGSGGAP